MAGEFDYSQFVGVGHNSAAETAEVTQLAEAQHSAELVVETLENELKGAKEKLAEIAEKKLPQKMDELGLSSYETTNGIKVQVSEKIRASLSPENKPRGYNWLEDQGYGGLIKTQVVVPFKRGELEKAKELVDKLSQEGMLATVERKIEAMTLTAFVKDQLVQGKELPLDVFGVFRQRIAKVDV